MMDKLPKSFVVMHDRLGPIHVTRRRSSSRISGRWKDGRAYFNVPDFLDGSRILSEIEQLASKMIAGKKNVKFYYGQCLEFDGLRFCISEQKVKPDSLICTLRGATAYIEVGSAMDLDDDATTESISRMMRCIASRMAPDILIPHARRIAATLGLEVKSWSIMNGHHVLGKCSSSGQIKLSYMNVFLPAELRGYIVCHELAHLKEMNHSRRFHYWCNLYCGGREAEFVKALNSYKWPLLRR